MVCRKLLAVLRLKGKVKICFAQNAKLLMLSATSADSESCAAVEQYPAS